MNKLDKTRYIPVVLEKHESEAFIYDINFQNQLMENAQFLEQLTSKTKSSAHINRDIYFNLLEQLELDIQDNKQDHENDKKSSTTELLKTLNNLCLKVKNCPDSIIDLEKYEAWLKSSILLVSERFMHPEAHHHTGSSRHVLLKDIQLKGSGRNNLISRLDYYHSWGGMELFSSLFEYISSSILDQSLYLGALKCPAIISLSNAEKINGKSNVVLLRDVKHAYRVGQIPVGYLGSTEKSILKKAVELNLGTNNYNEINQKISLQYVSLIYMNVYHYSMIAENITLDGRLIDAESIYNSTSIERKKIFFDLSISKEIKLKKEDIDSIQSLLKKINENELSCCLCNTNIHGPLYSMIKSEEVLSEIYGKENNRNAYSTFFNQLKELLSVEYQGNIEITIDYLKSLSSYKTYNHQTFYKDQSLNEINSLDEVLVSDALNLESFNLFSFTQEDNFYYLRFSLDLAILPKASINSNSFNSMARMDVSKIALYAVRELIETTDVHNRNYLLEKIIARNSFYFPYEIHENKIVDKPILSDCPKNDLISELKQRAKSDDKGLYLYNFGDHSFQELFGAEINKLSNKEVILLGFIDLGHGKKYFKRIKCMKISIGRF